MWHVCIYIIKHIYVLTYNMYTVYVYTYLACAPQQNRVLPTEMKPQTPGLCGTCAFPPRRRRRCEPSKLQRQHAAVGGIMDTLWHVTGDLNWNSPHKMRWMVMLKKCDFMVNSARLMIFGDLADIDCVLGMNGLSWLEQLCQLFGLWWWNNYT